MRKGKGDGQREEYAFRRLLGAVLVEAVLDALSEKGVRWQDRTSALAFLRDANVQALCDAHLALPPALWRAFAEAADRGVVIDYAVVEGLGSDRLVSASPTKQSKAMAGQSKASSPRKRLPAGESHDQAGAPPKSVIVAERTFMPEPAAQPASSGGLIGLMHQVRRAVGWPVAAGAG
jgi:hypothetical protein